jgi:hypothetical protein
MTLMNNRKIKQILLDKTDIEFFKNYSNYIIENYPFVDDEARHFAEKKEIKLKEQLATRNEKKTDIL